MAPKTLLLRGFVATRGEGVEAGAEDIPITVQLRALASYPTMALLQVFGSRGQCIKPRNVKSLRQPLATTLGLYAGPVPLRGLCRFEDYATAGGSKTLRKEHEAYWTRSLLDRQSNELDVCRYPSCGRDSAACHTTLPPRGAACAAGPEGDARATQGPRPDHERSGRWPSPAGTRRAPRGRARAPR